MTKINIFGEKCENSIIITIYSNNEKKNQQQ